MAIIARGAVRATKRITEAEIGRLSAPAGLWHSAATGLCFIGFWLMVLVATLVLLPVALLLPGDRERRARRLASRGFRLLLGAIEALGIIRFGVEGKEWIGATAGHLLVANHPCFLDIVALLAQLPDANTVMKAGLSRHPVFGLFVRAGGYLGNDAKPQQIIDACREARARGEAVVIFPEGSRTQPGVPPHFFRGAAQIALRAQMKILPVTVDCTPPVLTHGRPWYRMPARQARHVICFHQPRDPEDFALLDGLSPPLAARRLTRGLEAYFKHSLTVIPEAMNNRNSVSLDAVCVKSPGATERSPR